MTDHVSHGKAALLAVLQRHIGRRNGATVTQLERALLDAGWIVTQRQIRKLVELLRLDGHHVCAHPRTGYYIAETAEELLETCSFLHARAMTSLVQVARMRGVSVPDLRGQLRLPT